MDSMKVLIACSRLVEFAGVEITTLELAVALNKNNWVVYVASFEIGDDIKKKLEEHSIKYLDLSSENTFKGGYFFDLAWIHHSVSAYRILLDPEVRTKKAIFSSLSHFEPIEAPPVTGVRFSKYLVNSEENLHFFLKNYPDLVKSVSVFPNSAPSNFWINKARPISPVLSRLAIVSNHVPEEIYQTISKLKSKKICVDIFGIEGRREIITPEILHGYDAVVTIGKTVQYCIACRVPVYCYDHFGGDGWVTLDTFDLGRKFNFSGRGSRGKIEATKIIDELIDGYKTAIQYVDALYDIGKKHFLLEDNICKLLTELKNEFNISEISETDRNILFKQNNLFLKNRKIISNMALFLDMEKEKNLILKNKITNKQKTIEAINESLKTKEREIDVLESAVEELFRIKSSKPWNLFKSFYNIFGFIVCWKSIVSLRIFWGRHLFNRSITILRDEGFTAFVKRSFWYVGNWWKRTIVAKKIQYLLSRSFISKCINSGDVLVSFVIPVYDRTDVLREAIVSALFQTVKSIEVILVTDGSPEETLAVVNEFKKDSRVKIFNYPLSSGNAVRGRNKGILEARGKYIAFLDSDDVATCDRVESCLPFLESGMADVVYGAWQAILDGSRDVPGVVDGQVTLSPTADLNMLIDTCIPCQSTVIVRKSLFFMAGFLKPKMKYREDHELWARLAYFGAVFHSVPNVLTRLRLHEGNNEINFKEDSGFWHQKVHDEYTIPGPMPLKIAFLLPGVGIAGGIAVVFKHASLLMKNGHDAFVINVGEVGSGDWYPENPVPIVHISDSRNYLFENIDMLFATGWSTVRWLEKIPAVRKLYFVQSDERRFYEDKVLKKKIHDTYLTSCEYLTEAIWIKKWLYNEFGHEAEYVPNGIDNKVFFQDLPLEPKRPGRVRVLLEGPIAIPFKGMADSYSAIEGLDCEVWIVSSAGKPPANWKCDRFFEKVPFGEMRKIYSSCDIFLKMSRVEGFFGPPMEAMACGCAVVVAKVTGYDEYIIHGHNALVVEQGDIIGARIAVKKLIEDSDLRNRLINNGKNTVLEWSWDRSEKAMLRLVNKYLNQ